MITFLQHTEIDKEKWNTCIKNSQYPIVYAEAWYLDIVSPKWAAYVIEKNNRYVAVFPLTIKSKKGIKYVTQPPFCQQLGLFYTQKTDLEPFLELISKKYPLVEISLNASNVVDPHTSFETLERINQEMSLNSSYEKIYSNYNSNRKRDLKKSDEKGIYIKKTTDIDFFIKFFKNEKALDIKGLNSEVWTLLKQIYSSGCEKSAVELTFAYNHLHEICAVGLFLKSNQRVVFLLGTSNKEGQKNGSMTRLMDQIIQENCMDDMVLDFEGSMIPGVAKFYESLGGKGKKYISLKASRLPVLVKILKKLKGF